MRKMRKLIKLTVASIFLLAAGVGSTAYADNVSVSARVSPKAGLQLNFDSMNFNGLVGSTGNTATYSKTGTGVNQAQMTIRAKNNYTVAVSGSDLTTGGPTPVTLKVNRMQVQVDTGPGTPLSTTSTTIDNNSGLTQTTTVTKAVTFSLDLDDTGATTTYGDEANLTNLTADTDFTSSVTLSFTGL